jgi:hypothetical protein
MTRYNRQKSNKKPSSYFCFGSKLLGSLAASHFDTRTGPMEGLSMCLFCRVILTITYIFTCMALIGASIPKVVKKLERNFMQLS